MANVDAYMERKLGNHVERERVNLVISAMRLYHRNEFTDLIERKALISDALSSVYSISEERRSIIQNLLDVEVRRCHFRCELHQYDL